MNQKIALVTGAASGIGRATAQALGGEGTRVVCVDHDEPGARLAASKIGGSIAIGADVSCDRDCRTAVRAAAELGGLDVLVNVAGIMVDDDHVDRLSEEAWNRVLAVNLTSIFLMSRHAIPLMRSGGGGVIVNTASVHAFATMTGTAAYAASKGAIVALTRQMALDYAPDLIRVVAVAPGSVDTPLSHRAAIQAGVSSLAELGFSFSPRDVGHVGQSTEVAAAIAWLASGAASFVNGTTVTVDGALLARLV